MIDASLIGPHDGLSITSDNNIVKHLIVTHGSMDFYVSGNSNLLSGVHAWNAALDGIGLSGTSNTVDASVSGIASIFNTCAGAGNFGVLIYVGSQYNTVSNSSIGCNGAGGISIYDDSGSGNHTIGPNNVIGGATMVDASLANGGSGVLVGSSANTVISNTIGSNSGDGIVIAGGYNAVTGNTVISNTGSGLRLHGSAQSNLIGCSAPLCFPVDGNRFSANLRYGVEITGTAVAFNIVEGNQIGASASGTYSQSNMLGGILVDGAHDTTIGDALKRSNNISGNAGNGITLDHGAYNTSVVNNCIGQHCTPGFNLIMPNMGRGVVIQNGAHDNMIGLSGTGLSNTIASNGNEGVLIGGAGSANNTLSNNVIRANHIAGVLVGSGAHNNLVGGGDVNNRNAIIDNLGDGVVLSGGAYSNTLGYNRIGAYQGNAGPNTGFGITLDTGAHNNSVGLVDPAAVSNWVLFNGQGGVRLDGSTTMQNTLVNNAIEQNAGDGVRITNGAHDNSLGNSSQPAGNYVAFNVNGVSLSSAAQSNSINYNQIYLNTRHGVILTGTNTAANLISLATIFNNGLDGINQDSAAGPNAWTQLSIHDNGGLGIDLNAFDDSTNTPTPPFPIIRSVKLSGGVVTVTGTASAPLALESIHVELYKVALDPSGYGEGKTYLGNALTTAAGTWTISFPGTGTGCYTAFQTISSLGPADSSEFGPNSCRVFLPVVRR